MHLLILSKKNIYIQRVTKFYCRYFSFNSRPFIPSFLPLRPFFLFSFIPVPLQCPALAHPFRPSLPPLDYPPPSAQEDNGCVVVHFCTRCAESSPIKYLGEVSWAAEGGADPPIVTATHVLPPSPLRHPSPTSSLTRLSPSQLSLNLSSPHDSPMRLNLPRGLLKESLLGWRRYGPRADGVVCVSRGRGGACLGQILSSTYSIDAALPALPFAWVRKGPGML